jgi:hypothetical protein
MTTREALDAADATFRKVNADHAAVTKAYRARTVSDEVFLASRETVNAAMQAYDAAEAAYVAELEAKPAEQVELFDDQGELF